MVNVLLEANRIAQERWRKAGRGWRIFLAVVIVIAAVIGLVMFLLWIFVKFLKALSVGGTRNLGLYFPANRRR